MDNNYIVIAVVVLLAVLYYFYFVKEGLDNLIQPVLPFTDSKIPNYNPYKFDLAYADGLGIKLRDGAVPKEAFDSLSELTVTPKTANYTYLKPSGFNKASHMSQWRSDYGTLNNSDKIAGFKNAEVAPYVFQGIKNNASMMNYVQKSSDEGVKNYGVFVVNKPGDS